MKVWGLLLCVVLAVVACALAAPEGAVISALAPPAAPAPANDDVGGATPLDVATGVRCTAAWCIDTCRRLGYRYWQCIAVNTCRCWN